MNGDADFGRHERGRSKMNRMVAFFFAVFFVLNIASGIRGEDTMAQFGRFGKIALYLR